MARAYSPTEILAKKYKLLDWGKEWKEAFGNPEASGVWFVWGNTSNGKSAFFMQLVKELAKLNKVYINDLEEGTSLTMQQNLLRSDIESVKKNILIGSENMEEMALRLSKRKSARFVIVNSFQYTGLSISAYRKLKEANKDKLIIFISHAKGKQPVGRTADSVKFDASLKIWVEGFRAISNGRYNPGGTYTIWSEGANKYWGQKESKN